MEQSRGDGGEVAVKRPDLRPSGANAGEDRLSALPDDILVVILLRLDTIAEAARTSVLSRRWRRTWALLPELNFCSAPDNRHVLEVLAVPEAPALRRIHVATTDDAPESVAAWLPLAARRLSGDLLYHNLVEGHEAEVDGAIPLPCFGDATAIDLDLGFLAICCPSAGAFTRLAELSLERVRFQGTCDLGNVISSPRCPALRKLSLRHTQGLASLAVRSESLLQLNLYYLNGLQQLNIDAPALEELTLHRCFVPNQPIADISAPQLVSLEWRDAYDPSSVDLGNLGQLQRLGTYFFLVYGRPGNRHNRDFLCLLQRFRFIHSLTIPLSYAQAQLTCPSSCICDQPPNWKTEELSLNCLHEVEIIGLRGGEHEAVFVKLLFNWAATLEKIRIKFDCSVSKSKAKELCQRLSTFSRPEMHVQFYLYHNRYGRSDLLSLDEGTWV